MAIKIQTVDFHVDKHTWLPEPTEKELAVFLTRLQVANVRETLICCTNLDGERMNMETYLNSQNIGAFLVRTTSGDPIKITIIRAYEEK